MLLTIVVDEESSFGYDDTLAAAGNTLVSIRQCNWWSAGEVTKEFLWKN